MIMIKFKLLILVVIVFIAGVFTGLSIQNVDAEVKAPGEYNQPMVSHPTSKPVAAPTVGQVGPTTKPAKSFQQKPAEVVETSGVYGAAPERPMSSSAATVRGATLYSLSSSMQVDIKRLEEDVAQLKNKINILANMR